MTTATATGDPFEQAFFAMVHVPYLQPFDDVNKPVSRLAANIPFIKSNLVPLSFTDVPRSSYTHAILGVYELNRVDLLNDLFRPTSATEFVVCHRRARPARHRLER